MKAHNINIKNFQTQNIGPYSLIINFFNEKLLRYLFLFIIKKIYYAGILLHL